ncbi:cytochrome BD ubiquinol oxidase subunit I [Pseudodesulfovibrio sp. F-1]|uniref:Cytochrome BD ubiquinol oxidase subunit I n=1 Tax=Pseudodesulfovibrio alkaliphilus TaxID=2661613 RepID=A0A7K1KS13_9BACT|nr:cytochrome ubiquinol oxidase subunit I [Pseudodesulfovibrio alkaliphilus]MUM78889.1 cytochrome BD ubiquinol oxidase subunit I [Pseudodesulfovibrio alkaliphilus]
MEYPIWQLTTLGGGFWIALIATLHVYVAHFAIGGGLFLVLTEQAAYRTGNPHLLEYAKKHSRFFLLLTMAFGAVSGVAIWFTIALLAPQATITLIHNFVFAWAAEWVCFTGEIVALIIYYYTWDTMNRRDHLMVGYIYFIFGWFSLFLINGIVGFMLTPGDWLQTKDFWDGFFNPTFWSALVFRSFFSAACAGLFGFVTATRILDEETRISVLRSCSAWTIAGVLAVVATGFWYVASLPAAQHEMMLLKSHRVAGFMNWFWLFAGLTLMGGLIMALKMPRRMTFPLAMAVLMAGLGLFGSFEFIREAGRKPYLIWDYAYSNSIIKSHAAAINRDGALARARWTPPTLRDGITDENRMEAGAFLYQLQCSACHSIGGPMNDIRKRTAMYDTDGMDAFLTGMGKLNPYMPPFIGTAAERATLASYIAEELNGNPPLASTVIPLPGPAEAAPFDPDEDTHVLLAWTDQGMAFFAQTDRWTLLPPAITLRAQLILRDLLPEVVTDDVTLTYAVDPGVEGKTLTGSLSPHEDGGRFEATLNIRPYADGVFNPLPMATIEARDRDGHILAVTRVALPVSDQMGCRNCHGGDWAHDGSGISTATADNILAVHDRMNNTDHVARAKKGPILCVECHDDPIQNARGAGDRPNLSAAIHGSHAVYLAGREADDSCLKCHPQNTLRGLHDEVGLDCADCHGQMEDFAIALLRAEQAAGKSGAQKLLALLSPRSTGSREAIDPRTPWQNEPDCLTCHRDFAAPETTDAFNAESPAGLFSTRRDELGAVYCAACHGAPHAIHPATERDSIQPAQYTGKPQTIGANGSCSACHLFDMEDAAHHPGMGVE